MTTAESIEQTRIAKIIEKFRKEWPAAFAATKIDELSGDGLKRRTLANLRCKREIPEEVFLRHGRKLLIIRDELLDWWANKLSTT